jgi:hypothetical protein
VSCPSGMQHRLSSLSAPVTQTRAAEGAIWPLQEPPL